MDIINNPVNSNSIISINPPKRIRIESDDWIDKASRSRLLERWNDQELYIDYLESHLKQLEKSIETNERLREKEAECKKLKSMLKYRHLTKTAQQQSFEQMRDTMQIPSLSRLRHTYLDPSMNLIFGQMRNEIDQSRKTCDEAQNKLHAIQFTSDSKTGKMLMARCKKLHEENEELDKIISSDKVSKLEGEIALQNRLLFNMKDSQKDCEDIILDFETNMDAMSNTLLHLRNQLNESHRQINSLNEENTHLKTLYEFHNTNSSIVNTVNQKINRSDISTNDKQLYLSTSNNDLTNNSEESSSINEIMDVDSLS